MDDLSPVGIENHIRNLVTRITTGVGITNKLHVEFLEANREFDRAYALAFRRAEGAVEERKQQARIDTFEYREAKEDAEAKYEHAKNLGKALDLELRAYQSIGASVRTAYHNAGVGNV